MATFLPRPRPPVSVLLLAAMAFAPAACVPAGPPPPAYLTDPADPDRPVAPLVYESVTGGARTFRPVNPKGWEQQNQSVAPKPGEEGMGGMPGMDHGSMKGMAHGGMKGTSGTGTKDKDPGTTGGGMDDMPGMKGMGGK